MNTWRWESNEEFAQHVHPIEHSPKNAVRVARNWTGLKRILEFCRAVNGLEIAYHELKRIASVAAKPPTKPYSQDEFRDVWAAACQIVCQGEYALAYCKPLAETKGGEDFIERKSVFEQFPRYQKETWGSAKSGTTELLRATEELMKAIQEFWETDDSFLKNVPSLPDDLKTDFVAARDVMSLGFTEAGLIYAGRGLEGVVRRIATDHNLFPSKAIERVRFAEILTALETKRFSNDRKLVIDEQTKHRLHLSRAMRNHSAHPDSQRDSQGYREEAILMAQKANELWKKCSRAGIKIV
jgi:hypothetical protein